MKTQFLLFFCLGILSVESGFAWEAEVSRDLSFSTRCESGMEVATLSFVGDILIHQALYREVVQGTQHFSQIWRRTDGLVRKADFSVGNLEGPAALGIDRNGRDRGDVGFIYDGVVYSGTDFRFNYHPRILSDLKNSGYDLITSANNHALDRGSLGIDKTLEAARNIDLPVVGIRHSQERNASYFKVVQIRNMKIAFVGCTEMTNGIPDGKDQVLHCYRKPEIILDLIREVSGRSDMDAVIVLPHWGTEYSNTPNSQQQAFARRYLEAGATAVIGSHPHVLQPWEKYLTKDGRETLIAYSLGNFVAGQAGLERKTGVVVYFGLTKKSSKKAQITGIAYTPTYRQGAELFPVGATGAKDVLNHTALLFGNRARLEPTGDLLSELCRKD